MHTKLFISTEIHIKQETHILTNSDQWLQTGVVSWGEVAPSNVSKKGKMKKYRLFFALPPTHNLFRTTPDFKLSLNYLWPRICSRGGNPGGWGTYPLHFFTVEGMAHVIIPLTLFSYWWKFVKRMCWNTTNLDDRPYML